MVIRQIINPLIQLHDLFDDPKKLKAFLTKKRSNKAKEPMQNLMNLLRQGLKIGYTLAGKNLSDFDNKVIKVKTFNFIIIDD